MLDEPTPPGSIIAPLPARQANTLGLCWLEVWRPEPVHNFGSAKHTGGGGWVGGVRGESQWAIHASRGEERPPCPMVA